jgi:PAS domain S-box-containing protein
MDTHVDMRKVSLNRGFNYPLVWATEADGACSFLNQNWYSFTGQVPEKGLGTGWMQAISADERKLVARLLLKANEKRTPFQIEYRLRCNDGEYLWVKNTATPRFDKDGEFIGYIGLVKDIARRKINDRAGALIMHEGYPRVKPSLESVQEIPGITRHGNMNYDPRIEAQR